MYIKDCPVCGSHPYVACGTGLGRLRGEKCCYVECKCGAGGDEYKTPEEAVKAWNEWAN